MCNAIKKILYKIQGKIYRSIAKLFKYRSTSYPYISGDGFRSMADHIYDETFKCRASEVEDNDVVFLKTDMKEEWFTLIHPKIMSRYKLITHNSDDVIGRKESLYIDDKIIRWFAQNNIYKHEKIVPIPIGIENKHLFVNGWAFMKVVKKIVNISTIEKKNKILFGFNIKTNPKERGTAISSLRNSVICDEIIHRVTPIEHFNLLNKYKFVASPEGNGPDCIRTWEALAFKVVPIIKNSSDCQVIEQNNLPILKIKDWSEITNLSEEKLATIYNNYDFASKSDITMFDYWKEIIKKNEKLI
jgi:hypothetical protein